MGLVPWTEVLQDRGPKSLLSQVASRGVARIKLEKAEEYDESEKIVNH